MLLLRYPILSQNQEVVIEDDLQETSHRPKDPDSPDLLSEISEHLGKRQEETTCLLKRETEMMYNLSDLDLGESIGDDLADLDAEHESMEDFDSPFHWELGQKRIKYHH